MAENDPLGGLPPPAQAQQMFSDPAFLQGMAMIAAKHQRPEAMQWLERAHIAAKEGAFDAVGKLMAGDVQGAVQAWNQTGQFRDVINVNRNLDGTYAINRKDGSTFTLDPVKEYKRMLSPREYLAFQQNEAERKTLAEQRRLDQQHRADTLSEQRRYHDMMIDRYDADRAQRADQARANAAIAAYRATNAGGSRSRSSGSGGGGGSGGDGPARLKPAEMQRAWQDALKRADEIAAADPTANADELANTMLMQATARPVRNQSSGQWGIEVSNPALEYDFIEYDSREAAMKAYRDLMDRRIRPTQGRLLRDEDRAPGEGGPSIAAPAAPTPAHARRALPPIPTTVEEMRAQVREGESRREAAAKTEARVKASPEYKALAAKRKQAIMANDSQAITAIDQQMNALLRQ